MILKVQRQAVLFRSLATYNDTVPIDGLAPPAPSTVPNNAVQVNIVLEGITQSCSNPSGFSVDNVFNGFAL